MNELIAFLGGIAVFFVAMFDLWAFFLAGCVAGLVEAIGVVYQAGDVDLPLVVLCLHVVLAFSAGGILAGSIVQGVRWVLRKVVDESALAPYVISGMLFLATFVPISIRVFRKEFQNPILAGALSGVIAMFCAILATISLVYLLRMRRRFKAVTHLWPVIAMAAVLVGYLTIRSEVEKLDFPFLSSFNAFVAMGSAYAYVLRVPLLEAVALPLSNRHWLWLFVGVLIANLILPLLPHIEPRRARALERGAPLVAEAFEILSGWTDLDDDGFSSIFGQGDCKAFDPSVHPAALDYPDNGIDENCDGRDSTSEDLLSLKSPEYFSAPLPHPMNVILISVDALRKDHMGSYGYDRNTTPNLDRIASMGTRFIHSYSHSSRTLYSLSAFLYGVPINLIKWERRPKNQIALPEDLYGIPTVLREWGVYTIALLDCFRIFKLKFGLEKDFDDYDTRSVCVSTYQPKLKKAPDRTRAAIRKLKRMDRKRKEEPFFLWIHYLEPHAPYRSMSGSPNFGDDAMDHYDSTVHYTDRAIGTLWDYLEDSGLTRNTAVIITGDHGDEFREHGRRYHGKTLYNETIGVPLIIYLPGVLPQVTEAPASHLDLAPTILNLFQVPDSRWPKMYGTNLLPVIFGQPNSGRKFTFSIHAEKRRFKTVALAYIEPPWTIISKPRKRSYEVYHIEDDYLQQEDLYHPEDSISQELVLKVDRLMHFLELEKSAILEKP